MDSNALAQVIAAKVAADTSYWVAVIGFSGVLVGTLGTVLGSFLLHILQSHRRSQINRKRKLFLQRMLRDDRFSNHWRRLETLAKVIGADLETTKELLIEVDARGSEKDDGFWGLLEYHPLEVSEQ